MIVADLVMSVDNVIAIAGAAKRRPGHQMPLVIFGLLVSIPIIVWGSQLVIKLMDRFPIIITLGGMLLGWIAGQMIYTDPGHQALSAGRQGVGVRRGRVRARCWCWSIAKARPGASEPVRGLILRLVVRHAHR